MASDKKLKGRDLVRSIRSRIERIGGIEIPDTPREPIREPKGFHA